MKQIIFKQGKEENLPLPQAGSILITTDTKKIYIDPINGEERFVIKEGAGEKTAQNGEIFNDYENNQALSAYTTSHGSGNISGGKAFTITATEDLGNGTGKYTLSSITGLETNMQYSAVLSIAEYHAGKIIAIDGNVVTVDGYIYHDINPNKDDASNFNVFNCFIITGRPDLGDKDIGFNAFALGNDCYAQNVNSIAAGKSNRALGKHSAAFGYNNIVGHGAFAEGGENKSLGQCSHTEGSHNIATRGNTHAEGTFTQALFDNAHAEGSNTIAGKADSFAYAGITDNLKCELNKYYLYLNGKFELITNVDSWTKKTRVYTLQGKNVVGNSSHAEGYINTATETGSHAEGRHNYVSSTAGHVEGELNVVMNPAYASHAEGGSNVVSGNYAHAEGQGNLVTASKGHAEGGSNKVSGGAAHAEGAENNVTANYAHVEGYYSNAKGQGAHAEGYNCSATGQYSHAEGFQTQAIGDNSHAGGKSTKATGESQTVIGEFNEIDDNALFIIGNGSAKVEDETGKVIAPEVRQNAFKVMKDGSLFMGIGGKNLLDSTIYNQDGWDVNGYTITVNGTYNPTDSDNSISYGIGPIMTSQILQKGQTYVFSLEATGTNANKFLWSMELYNLETQSYESGFTVPAGDTWEFTPTSDYSMSTAGVTISSSNETVTFENVVLKPSVCLKKQELMFTPSMLKRLYTMLMQ